MRKITWILFIIYFFIFVGAGVFFYFRYLDKFLFSGAEPSAPEIVSSQEQIYYSEKNNLYRVASNMVMETETSDRLERFQSTGEVGSLDITRTGQKIAYSAKTSEGLREIWQVESQTNNSQKIAFSGAENFEGYENFLKPKYSPDTSRLAILASQNQSDAIFIINLATGSPEKLTKENIRISDYSWSKDSENIIYCSENLSQNGCWLLAIKTGRPAKLFDGDILEISAEKTDNIYYLKKESQTANIYGYNIKNQETSSLSDLQTPKTINNFDIDISGNNIAYEVLNNENADIYFSKLDARDKIQLTTDGQSRQPIFSKKGSEIAFWRQGVGINSIETSKSNLKKIVNLKVESIRLLIWR